MHKKIAINLFYSLPDELMYIIHKKIFSMCVLEELKNRPGNFNFLEHYYDEQWKNMLERDYRVMNKIGTDAWNFVKKYDDFIWEANRLDPMYKTILDNIGSIKNFHNGRSFNKSMYHMTMIARHGWENYKSMF